MRRRCIPVYWRGEHRRVLRGHWYVRKGGLDWLPLREDVAEQLEIAYHKKVIYFGPLGIFCIHFLDILKVVLYLQIKDGTSDFSV